MRLPELREFKEALQVTATAKNRFTREDLLARGRRFIERSLTHGATSILAHVEVDPTVGLKCVDAGAELKAEYADRCDLHLAVFAQDAIFEPTDDAEGRTMLGLLKEACDRFDVSAIGSAPYVDSRPDDNLEAILDMALDRDLPLQLHLDYDLNPPASSAQVWTLLGLIKRRSADGAKPPSRRFQVTIGHATKLCVFPPHDLDRLAREIHECSVPIHFIGLPPSDLYMMGRPSDPCANFLVPRGTLPVFELLRRGLSVSASINNVANAFTPQGDCDPLELGPLGTACWQTATPDGVLDILNFVTTGAAASIPVADHPGLRPRAGDRADFVVMCGLATAEQVVLAPYSGTGRITIRGGKVVARTETSRWVAGS